MHSSRLISEKRQATRCFHGGKVRPRSRFQQADENLPLMFVLTVLLFLFLLPPLAAAQKKKDVKSPSAVSTDHPAGAPEISLSPRFSVGQSFRYVMEFETSTATTRSGFAADPQGPGQITIRWNATLTMDVLPSESGSAGSTRLRITYEKSAANVGSDSFDPTANATEQQYRNLEGKAVEFTLDTSGKVLSISGLQGILEDDRAAHAAMQWIAQLNAGSGAPAGGVQVGDKWSTEQPATSLLLSGLVWRSDSQYVRNEVCHPPNPDKPRVPAPAGLSSDSATGEMCAVILTHLNLERLKPVRGSSTDKNAAVTEGTWTGSGEGLSYVSLRSGLAVSITQGATEDMDITITSPRNSNMRYAGKIVTRSQVALQDGETAQKK